MSTSSFIWEMDYNIYLKLCFYHVMTCLYINVTWSSFNMINYLVGLSSARIYLWIYYIEDKPNLLWEHGPIFLRIQRIDTPNDLYIPPWWTLLGT